MNVCIDEDAAMDEAMDTAAFILFIQMKFFYSCAHSSTYNYSKSMRKSIDDDSAKVLPALDVVVECPLIFMKIN